MKNLWDISSNQFLEIFFEDIYYLYLPDAMWQQIPLAFCSWTNFLVILYLLESPCPAWSCTCLLRIWLGREGGTHWTACYIGRRGTWWTVFYTLGPVSDKCWAGPHSASRIVGVKFSLEFYGHILWQPGPPYFGPLAKTWGDIFHNPTIRGSNKSAWILLCHSQPQ